MKTVALLVIYFGYGLVAYGLDHLTNNCTPFGCVMLGQFAGSKCSGTGSVPCPKSTTSSSGTSSSGTRTRVPGSSLPSGTNPTPGIKGTYTAPPLPGTQVYGGGPGTFSTAIPPGGYAVR